VSVPLSKQFRWPFGVNEDDGVEFWDKDETTAPIRDVPIDRMSATQRELDMDKVHRIASNWDDIKAPPIVAQLPGPDGRPIYPIGDGHHRVAAALLLGKKTIKAQVV
jgi:ParB-like chromosome segregation protein Spo0J